MELKMIPIKDIKPHPKNPRVHPDSALDKLEKSIGEFGFTNPVLLSKDGILLAGHARVKASKRKGLKEVPAIYLDLEGAKADAYLIADNRLQQDTKWEKNMLKIMLEELDIADYPLDLTGFELDEIEKMLGNEEEEEKEPELEFTPELLEEHNYIVLYFDNQLDWQVAKEKFNIKAVHALDSREGYERKGIGRVFKGSDILDRIT